MQTIADGDVMKHLARLLDAVEHGEEVTITREGKPVARLVPVIGGGRTEDETELDADLQKVWATHAANEIRRLGQSLRLDGLTIRDLINDGRR